MSRDGGDSSSGAGQVGAHAGSEFDAVGVHRRLAAQRGWSGGAVSREVGGGREILATLMVKAVVLRRWWGCRWWCSRANDGARAEQRWWQEWCDKGCSSKMFFWGGYTSGGVEKRWQRWRVKGDGSGEQELAVMVV